jgi:alanyl-tRNA synthetase
MTKPQYRYFGDPLCFQFETDVRERRTLPDGRTAVILEETYFYPTGGGQEHDTGVLGEARVIDVIRDEETQDVLHVVDRDVPLGPVSAAIDRERRLRHMQHHTAQHLLSGCFDRLLGLDTLSSHISGDTPASIDFPDVELTDAQIVEVEDLAHEIIFQDRAVKTYFVPHADIETVPLRLPPKVGAEVRVVEIEDFDYSACGATHLPRAGMIGMLKFVKTERQNQKRRIYFVAGYQALDVLRDYHHTVTALAESLSVGPQDLAETVARQTDELKAAQKEAESLRLTLLGYEAGDLAAQAETVGPYRVVKAKFEGRLVEEIQSLAKEFLGMEAVIALLVGRTEEKFTLVAVCSQGVDLSAREILQAHMEGLRGGGGGSDDLAQGGGTISEEQFETIFERTEAILDGLMV